MTEDPPFPRCSNYTDGELYGMKLALGLAAYSHRGGITGSAGSDKQKSAVLRVVYNKFNVAKRMITDEDQAARPAAQAVPAAEVVPPTAQAIPAAPAVPAAQAAQAVPAAPPAAQVVPPTAQAVPAAQATLPVGSPDHVFQLFQALGDEDRALVLQFSKHLRGQKQKVEELEHNVDAEKINVLYLKDQLQEKQRDLDLAEQARDGAKQEYTKRRRMMECLSSAGVDGADMFKDHGDMDE